MRISRFQGVIVISSSLIMGIVRLKIPKVHALPLKYFILIDPLFKDHTPLLVHEITHIAQQKRWGLQNFHKRYKECKNFRWQCELEAHTNEFDAGGELIEIALKFKTRYGLEARDGGSIIEELRKRRNGRVFD